MKIAWSPVRLWISEAEWQREVAWRHFIPRADKTGIYEKVCSPVCRRGVERLVLSPLASTLPSALHDCEQSRPQQFARSKTGLSSCQTVAVMRESLRHLTCSF